MIPYLCAAPLLTQIILRLGIDINRAIEAAKANLTLSLQQHRHIV
jgi:hypothetical protein